MSAPSPPQTARALSSDENIWSKEYWAKKGDISLYLFRKRMGDPAVDRVARPILFLAHGSSVSSRPSFDLIVPGHDDYSLMDKFAEYGFDVWTMDFEGYGRSSHGPGNSDVATGAEDLKAASEVVLRETAQPHFHLFGESSGALRAGVSRWPNLSAWSVSCWGHSPGPVRVPPRWRNDPNPLSTIARTISDLATAI
jgi:pimeloyl-ACP methyl ester carboxylesterase